MSNSDNDLGNVTESLRRSVLRRFCRYVCRRFARACDRCLRGVANSCQYPYLGTSSWLRPANPGKPNPNPSLGFFPRAFHWHRAGLSKRFKGERCLRYSAGNWSRHVTELRPCRFGFFVTRNAVLWYFSCVECFLHTERMVLNPVELGLQNGWAGGGQRILLYVFSAQLQSIASQSAVGMHARSLAPQCLLCSQHSLPSNGSLPTAVSRWLRRHPELSSGSRGRGSSLSRAISQRLTLEVSGILRRYDSNVHLWFHLWFKCSFVLPPS